VVLVLYGGGAILGLFLLLKRRWVVWKPAVYLAGAIALLTAGAFLTQWPLEWMEYDTAVSAASFAAQRIIYSILNGLFLGILALVALVAGESLTRRAFPRHPQLWKLWSPDGARSRAVLGRTVGAFLLVGVMLAYLTVLYAFAREHLGWWLPSASLTDPNVVASFVPWLFPLALSLQAGVVEEAVFRAIPLAGAVLLGRRFGGQRYWVAGALLLQAIVFGAAHADYPAQPAWARLVEIAVPFVFIGAIYLVFGLLPAIVMHFGFDVVMFSLPLFASSAPGVWLDRALVVLLALVPLWVVLYARLRHGRWIDLPDALRNGGWSPLPVTEEALEKPEPVARGSVGRRTATGLAAAGVLGLLLWGFLTPFHADAPPIGITRANAVAAARAALEERGVTLDGSWKQLPSVGGDVGLADLFVWQEGGPETYRSVIGSHIEAPHWQVRYARFEGDVVERAEEYLVHVDSNGQVFRVQHRLPERRPGASLPREDARVLAADAIRSTLGLDPSALREVSAEPSEHPARRDWTFTFEDPAVSVGGDGEARLAVTIAGDEVVDVFRHVHVPEEWQRGEQEHLALSTLISNVCGFPVGLGLLAAAVAGLVRWSRGRFARPTFVAVFLGLAAVLALSVLNAWPVMSAGFSTSQPWTTQALMGVGAGLIGAVFFAALLGLVAGFVHRWLPPTVPTSRATTLLRGAALGAVWAGLAAVALAVAPSRAPLWSSLTAAGGALPWIGTALEALRSWVMQTLLLLLLVGGASALSRGGGARRLASPLLLIGSGLILFGAGGPQPFSTWLVSGLLAGATLWLSYELVLRFEPSLVPIATAAMTVLALAREAALGAYPGAASGAALAIVALGGVSFWWAGRLERDTRAPEDAPAATS
jgi:membrane protease YdiL (CAAX protease family)